MELYFMRHGKAESVAERDEDRALTQEGIFQAEDTAEAFLKREWTLPKKIIVSEYRRAVETAEAVSKKLGVRDVKVVSYKDVTHWPDMRAYVTDEPILFIGHQPSLGEVIEEITGKSVPVKKASLHKIDYDPMKDTGTYIDKIERVKP
ncbi:MAG: phosphohistidine phosphatase SixA [Peptoniphilus sp.]|nr:phosphohistidine phosphatase SixA [Peptoniphilus sp.]MDD7363778.1 phosphohistidine phosphatase SixA [Bacillota bacterium]MDY6044619.1 phosphohistidine phosphatase SixA [Peptoniphilus sp.]